MITALGVTCLALILAHGAPGLDHMAGMDEGDHPAKVALSLCLAVVQGGLILLAVIGGTALMRRRSPRRIEVTRPRLFAVGCRERSGPPARAGPAVLQVFLR